VRWALLLLLSASSFADEIVLAGGGRLAGEIVAESEAEVTVRLPNGTMVLPRARIASIVREDRRDYLRREAAGASTPRAAVDLYERAFAVAPDDETRRDLAGALTARAAELLGLYRLDEAARALARRREIMPGADTDLEDRVAAELALARESEASARAALAARRFDEALVHIERWRLRRPERDDAVRGALATAHLGAGREAEARGNLRPALDHYRMAEASADLERLAPIAVLEALHGGDFERAARFLDALSTYRDPAVPRFLAAVLAHLRGEVAEAVRAYADAARLATGGGAGEGVLSYEDVRAYAMATLKAAIARPPQEGQRKWRELFLGPLELDDRSSHFRVYAARADVAREAADAADALYARIATDLFGGPPPGPPAELVLHPTREAYVAADPTPAGSPLAGLALGREPTAGVCYDTLDDAGATLIRVEVDAGHPRWASDTLPHELVHVAQRRGWKTFRKGHWLDEGLATLYESQAAQDSRLALWRQLGEEAIPLPELLALRSTPPDRAALFYLEAHAFTRYLRGLGGDAEWRRFLDLFGETDFERAARSVYGVESLADLERAFRNWRG
jgi:hypothetical protein